MRTRSQSRDNFPQQEASPAIVKPLRIQLPFLEDQSQEDPPVDLLEVPMADNRTMAELLQAPTKGYEDAIVIPEIAANNFELKHGLINLVQTSSFSDMIKKTLMLTSCMRTRSSSNLIIEPITILKRWNRRRSKQIVEPELRTIVETPVGTMADTRTMSGLLQAPAEGYGDAIVLPPILAENFELKTINLKNDIANFQQRFDESFGEAWDHFEDLLRKYPHYSFSKLHQIDTFYNALTQSDQDSLNAAAGGNLLNRTPRDALTIIENRSKVRISRNKMIVSKVNSTTSSPSPSLDVTALTEIVKELVLMNKATQHATVKSVEETCVTCGKPHPYYECLATGGNTFDACAAVGTYNQGANGYRPLGDPNYRARNQMR
nr:hypothetical protein [Tanacetum cinerariifolium]